MRKRDEIERKIHKLRQDKACVPTTGRTIRDIIDSAYIAGCIDCLKWALQKPGDPDNCVPPKDEVPEKELKVNMVEQVVVEDHTVNVEPVDEPTTNDEPKIVGHIGERPVVDGYKDLPHGPEEGYDEDRNA
jgi:hypothetical protein